MQKCTRSWGKMHTLVVSGIAPLPERTSAVIDQFKEWAELQAQIHKDQGAVFEIEPNGDCHVIQGGWKVLPLLPEEEQA